MNIREFLFYSQMSVEQLATQIGITRWYLDRIINRGQMPSKKLREKLKTATKGQVPIPDGLHVPSRRTKFKRQFEGVVTVNIVE